MFQILPQKLYEQYYCTSNLSTTSLQVLQSIPNSAAAEHLKRRNQSGKILEREKESKKKKKLKEHKVLEVHYQNDFI